MVEIDIEGFFSRYLNRDLEYMLGGGLFIEIIWYNLYNQLLLFPLSWEHAFKLIVFLAISYLFGFMFDKIGDFLVDFLVYLVNKIKPFRPFEVSNDKSNDKSNNKLTYKMLPENYKSGLVLRKDLLKKYEYDGRTLDLLERHMTLWILGKSVGVSAIFGGIFCIFIKLTSVEHIKTIISQYYWILLIVFGFCMLMIGWWNGLKKYHKEQNYLVESQKEK